MIGRLPGGGPELVGVLCNRRYTELSVGYVESHDQALVGDQTLGWRPPHPPKP